MSSENPSPTAAERADQDPGARWMADWSAGDDGAFERIVERYSGSVYALVTRFMGNYAGREDLVQEVFLRVVRARDRYKPTARFTTWLYRIVFNLCVNEGERAQRRSHRSLETGRDGEERGPLDFEDADQEQPAEGMERADLVRQVREAIGALPEKQRMALVLAKYHEMPYVEIADVLESSEKAIKSLIHRAREALRERLAPLLKEELA